MLAEWSEIQENDCVARDETGRAGKRLEAALLCRQRCKVGGDAVPTSNEGEGDREGKESREERGEKVCEQQYAARKHEEGQARASRR